MKEITLEASSELSIALRAAAVEPVRIKTTDGHFILATEEDFEFHSETQALANNEQLHLILDKSRKSSKQYSLDELWDEIKNDEDHDS